MNLLAKKIKRRLNLWKKSIVSSFLPERQPSSAFAHLFKSYHVGATPPKLLLLGDSVAERVSWNDYDDRTLAEIVVQNLRGITDVAVVSYGGFTLEVFYYLMLALEKMKHKPDLIVLPINMRNFSPQWDLEPMWQFLPEIEEIKRFIANPSLRSPVGRAQRETISTAVFNSFDATPVKFTLSPFNRIAQFRLLINSTPATEEQRRFRLQQIFVFHYTNKLAMGHRKLNALENILELLKIMRLPFFAYITPLNVDAGERFVGPEFSVALRENVQIVTDLVYKYLTGSRSVFKNWSETMHSEYFFHADNATEHLNEAGRIILAESISNEASALMDKVRSGT